MIINGVNSVSGLKVNNSKKQRVRNNPNMSFKGHVLTTDNEGKPVYKFFYPNSPENLKLMLGVCYKDKDGNYKLQKVYSPQNMPTGFEPINIQALRYLKDKNAVLGYQFRSDYTDNNELKHDYFRDEGPNIDGYTIAVPISNANPHRNRLMQHILFDSFNVANPASAKRNHFNILGGKIKDVEAKIPELASNGFGEGIGNPMFGQDNKSNHGYWTVNARQITKNIGSYKDYKNLMITLFQNGMGWTADGAFVNEGIEGIHLNDINNWGAKSPFVPLFETKNLENVQVRYGVLSKNDEVNKHIHIKLVNAPYKIEFEKTADGFKEKAVTKSSVDATKATYIQLFDDRLVTEKQANENEIFDVYEIKEPKDSYEISSSRDSVQPLHFIVKPGEVEANYKKFKEITQNDETVEFKDFLTQWTNFSIVNANKDGGVALWVGNNDIAKKRFVLSESSLADMKLSPEQQELYIAAQYQNQDDNVQIGEFWTSESARILTQYTARHLADRVSEYMNSSDGRITKKEAYQKAVDSLIKEHILPYTASSVTEKETFLTEDKKKEEKPSALDNMLSFNKYTKQRNYTLRPTYMPENITDGVMKYPLEAIEVAGDLTTVFAYPYIKNIAVSKDTVGLSRYEMYQLSDKYYNKIPKAYRETYKLADKLYAGVVTDKALMIMKKVDEKIGGNCFDGDNLTQEGKELYSLLAPDVAKFLFVSAIAPELKFDENSDVLEYDADKLRQYGLNKLNLQYETSPENTALRLLNKIEKGMKSIPEEYIEKFSNYLANRVKGIDSDAINVAKLIIDKTEMGLDWRIDAAKDVGDWDAVASDRFPASKNEKNIMDIWAKFNAGAKKHNPNTYKIGEITDWKNLNKAEFLSKSGFDTMTDYESFYSDLVKLYANNDEGRFSYSDFGNNNFANDFRKSFKKFMSTGTADSLNFTHRFVGNHDKPRILHLLATDVKAFNKDKSAEVQRVIEKGFDGSADFQSLDYGAKKSIKDALVMLRNGFRHVDGVKKEFDSENFGVRPFDYSINDAINEAAVNNQTIRDLIKNNPDKIERIKSQTLEKILEPALTKYRTILFAMVGLPGTPTLYSGDEFGQTGWETPCKNEKQENRNAVRWDLLDNKNYGFIKDFYENRYIPVTKIRSLDGASALVNGTTMLLDGQGLRGLGYPDNRGGVVTMYRYNDKTDAIVLLHGYGYGATPDESGKLASVDYISLNGMRYGLPKGTRYVDALNPERKFKVVSEFAIKEIYIDEQNKEHEKDYIDLGNAGLILLREESFDGLKYKFNNGFENTDK